MLHSIRITKQALESILSTEYPVVRRRVSMIEGHKMILYSYIDSAGKVNAIGALSEGAFITWERDKDLAEVINTIAKGQQA